MPESRTPGPRRSTSKSTPPPGDPGPAESSCPPPHVQNEHQRHLWLLGEARRYLDELDAALGLTAGRQDSTNHDGDAAQDESERPVQDRPAGAEWGEHGGI